MANPKPVLPEDEASLRAFEEKLYLSSGRALTREDGSDAHDPHPRRLATPEQLEEFMNTHIAAESMRVELKLAEPEARRRGLVVVTCAVATYACLASRQRTW